jgi:hypothetical protein
MRNDATNSTPLRVRCDVRGVSTRADIRRDPTNDVEPGRPEPSRLVASKASSQRSRLRA